MLRNLFFRSYFFSPQTEIQPEAESETYQRMGRLTLGNQ